MIPAGAGTADNTSNRGASTRRASGTWKWPVGKTVMTLRLNQEGDKLTGALIADHGPETVIEDGKYNQGGISFKVSRQVGKAMATAEYAGKVNGDTIKGGMSAYIGSRPKTLPRPAFWQASAPTNKRTGRTGQKVYGNLANPSPVASRCLAGNDDEHAILPRPAPSGSGVPDCRTCYRQIHSDWPAPLVPVSLGTRPAAVEIRGPMNHSRTRPRRWNAISLTQSFHAQYPKNHRISNRGFRAT